MPLISLLKNKLLLSKHYNVQERDVNDLPFWQFEEIIKLVNELTEDENKDKETQEKGQQQSFNPGSYMRDFSSMANKFK